MHMPGQEEFFGHRQTQKDKKNCPEGVDKGSAI